MTDKTNYAQSLMHMIKGNLGTGILAMPASFAHTGLINAIIGLPILCLISTYCVHLLVKTTEHLEGKTKNLTIEYASLAKHSIKCGPEWMRAFADPMSRIVDCILLVSQFGVCCVYLVFVVDNITSILASYNVYATKTQVFTAIFPIALMLSFIRTLKRLAIASAVANVFQAVGISIILEYLVRDVSKLNVDNRDKFMPLKEVALGFGSAMFAFEGISVVLPVFNRMKNSNQMSGSLGVINLSYFVLLMLYFIVGFFGFLRFGRDAKGSITLNLPPEPLYDAVRGMFTISLFLTYPLQFYVLNEIIWNWVKNNLLRRELEPMKPIEPDILISPIKLFEKGTKCGQLENEMVNEKEKVEHKELDDQITATIQPPLRYEYACRTLLVVGTFILAISVPKLNLLMDFIGSISGTLLSLVIPSIIHIAAFWDEKKGISKTVLIFVDGIIIAIGLVASASGSVFSVISIIDSFHQPVLGIKN